MGHLDPGAAARFARGNVSPDESAAMHEHLAGCAECRARVEGRPAEAQAETQSQPLAPRGQLRPQHGADHDSDTAGFAAAAAADGSDAPPPLDRGRQVGRYLVLNTVGQGGMGVVYAAYDPELDRKVALKVLRPGRKADGQARLLREAQAMARVSHPNVISVFDVGTLDERVFVAMEFIDGPTLKQWVREKPRSWREIVDVFLQAGRGLEAAHAAGLVHRDFKPENVLVAKDGRAYVTDFGLARLVEGEHTDEALAAARAGDDDSGRRLNAVVTQDGQLIGTPQYMAPEQHLGLPPDARSDQFSFCAALYWALYRRRPFDPEKLSQAASDADADSPTQPVTPLERQERTSGSRMMRISVTGRGVIQEPPREVKLPTWVRKAILKGLELEPNARYGSMNALLSELSQDPWVARRRLLIGAAAVLAVGFTALAYQQGRAQQDQLCSGAERKLGAVWTSEARDRIERAFLGTGKAFARDAASQVDRTLDTYAESWAAMHRDACEATRIRGEQTDQVLSLRMICLDRRLQDLSALTTLLSQADAKVVEKAVDAASALPSLRRCADVEALTQQQSLPEDPPTRAALQALGAELARAKALQDAGRFKDALELATAAAAKARTLHYLPVLAEALHLQGWLQDRSGDGAKAVVTLEEAYRTAEAARDDVMKITVATKLVYTTGYTSGQLEQAHLWARLARASLDRVGHNEELEIDLLTNLGSLFVLEGKAADALGPYNQAIAFSERLYGPDHPKRAMILTNLGVAYTRNKEFAKARKALEEALALIDRTKGPNHPSAAYPHNNLSDLLKQQKDFEGAYFHVQKALSIWEATLGPDHPAVGDITDSLGSVLAAQGRHAEALEQFRRALAIKEKALGPDHTDLSYSSDGIGQSLFALGRAREAVPYLERALKLRSEDPIGVAETRFALAKALFDSGLGAASKDRARTLAAQAEEGYSKAGEAEELAKVKAWLARAQN